MNPLTQVGQKRIVAELDRQVRAGKLHPLGARALVEAKNWNGALEMLRWLNEKPRGCGIFGYPISEEGA